nr:DUF6624 domain-containing protein [uncultured Mucilaginibacter sp.]
MKILITLLLFSIAAEGMAQKQINLPLKKQLDSVMALDQKYREILTYLAQPTKRDSVAKSLALTVNEANMHYWKLQNHIDSSNLAFIERVFDKYGYPGKTLVGSPTNESAWNLIQHSNKIDRYLPLIKKAAEENELPFSLYAMMLDRQLMNEGKEQVYGTQAMTKKLKNGKVESFIWPIKNPNQVNRLRKEAGFATTVEENAKRFNIVYQVVAIDEVK